METTPSPTVVTPLIDRGMVLNMFRRIKPNMQRSGEDDEISFKGYTLHSTVMSEFARNPNSWPLRDMFIAASMANAPHNDHAFANFAAHAGNVEKFSRPCFKTNAETPVSFPPTDNGNATHHAYQNEAEYLGYIPYKDGNEVEVQVNLGWKRYLELAARLGMDISRDIAGIHRATGVPQEELTAEWEKLKATIKPYTFTTPARNVTQLETYTG